MLGTGFQTHQVPGARPTGQPLNHQLPVPGCQACFTCSHEPGLLENLQVQSATDPGVGNLRRAWQRRWVPSCLLDGAWVDGQQEEKVYREGQGTSSEEGRERERH